MMTIPEKLLSWVLFLGTATLVACGGGSGSSGTGGGGAVQTTAITTTQQGGQASFTGAQAARLADIASTDSILMALDGAGTVPANLRPAARSVPGSGEAVYDRLRTPLADVVRKHKTLQGQIGARISPMVVSTGSVQCAVAGSYDYTRDVTLTSEAITVTYHDCNEFGSEVWNGVIGYGVRLTGLNSAVVNITLGNGDTVTEAGDLTVATYSGNTLLSSSIFSLDYKVTMNALLQTAVDYRLQMNGAFQLAYTPDAANGTEASKTYTETYDRFDAHTTWDNATTLITKTIDGGLRFARVDNAVSPAVTQSASLTYRNLALTSQTNASGNQELTVNGTVSSDYTPDICFEGTFTFATITPIVYDALTGQAIAGHITINGTVHIIFNADGSVSVSTDGGATYITYTRAELEGICLLPWH